MALYAISDLHLPLGVDKPMDVFGKTWENYVARLAENWRKTVSQEDTVVLPGDFSWATYLPQAHADFSFLHDLPGKKVLLKGNHDYWWTTRNKLDEFMREHGFSDICFLQNDALLYGETALCGTRGWAYGEAMEAEDEKIYAREVARLRLSLDAAQRLSPKQIIVFLHYPPVTPETRENRFTAVLEEYGVKACVFGHIHAAGHKSAVTGNIRGVEYLLVSCDYLGFCPVKLCD